MAANNSDKNHDKHLYHPVVHSSAMTPSIITTINNTNPISPPNNINNNHSNINSNSNINNNNNPIYESYIEDSFVGHWEREDDDIIDIYKGNNERDYGEATDEEDSALHPSTIEFDFDSFGPESIIYAPLSTQTAANNEMVQKVGKQELEQRQDDDRTPTSIKREDTIIQDAEAASQRSSSIMDNNSQASLNRPDPGENANDASEIKGKKMVATEELKVQNLIKNDTVDTINSNQHRVIQHDVRRREDSTTGSPFAYHLVDSSQIDLRVIEPYKKVISHAGYCHHLDPTVPASDPGEPAPAIIVFSACYLPDRSRRDYNYVMDQLFLYVLSSLHELIADDYILVYLHNTQPSSATTPSSSRTSTARTSVNESSPINNNISTNHTFGTSSTATISTTNTQDSQYQNNLPTFTWIKRCYQMIDRKLRKNLKILYLVKPTFWLKTIVIMCKPFISAKFSKKLRFVENMDGLKKCLPVDKLILPASAEYI